MLKTIRVLQAEFERDHHFIETLSGVRAATTRKRNNNRDDDDDLGNRAATKRGRSGGRNVLWEWPNAKYKLIRTGEPFATESAIHEAAAASTLHERQFYVFQIRDGAVRRNRDEPVFEACFYVRAGDYYVRVKKSHLNIAYRNAERTRLVPNVEHAMMTEDGTPYWVDRHMFCKQGQRASRLRHVAKMRSGKK
jgi:hypothetical protein